MHTYTHGWTYVLRQRSSLKASPQPAMQWIIQRNHTAATFRQRWSKLIHNEPFNWQFYEEGNDPNPPGPVRKSNCPHCWIIMQLWLTTSDGKPSSGLLVTHKSDYSKICWKTKSLNQKDPKTAYHAEMWGASWKDEKAGCPSVVTKPLVQQQTMVRTRKQCQGL